MASLTVSGNEITDAVRSAATAGDGLASPDSSFGIWEAATNLIANGGLETNTTGWAGTGISRVTTKSKFGGACLEMAHANGNLAYFNVTGLTPSVAYRLSAWCFVPVGSTINLVIQEFTAADAFVGQTGVELVGNGAWQRVTVARTFGATGVKATCYVINAAGPTMTHWLDGVQLEQKAIATPYVETDGATASRSAARVQVPVSTDHGVFQAVQQLGAETFVYAVVGLGAGRVLASTGPNGAVYVSTDYGVTWTLVAANVAGGSTAHDLLSLSGGIVLAGTDNAAKVSRSTDSGATWTNAAASPSLGTGSDICNCFADVGGGIVLAGVREAGGGGGKVFRSTDYGASWDGGQLLGGSGQGVNIITYLGNGVVVLGGFDDLAVNWFRSADYGATWTRIVSGVLNATDGEYGHAGVSLGGGVAVIGTYGGASASHLYRTTDYGATWALVYTSSGIEGFFSLADLGQDVLLAGSGIDAASCRVYASFDAGASWTVLQSSFGVLTHVLSLTRPGDGRILFGAGTTGQVWRSGLPAGGRLDETQGWFAVRMRMGWVNTGDPSGNPVVFDWRDDADNLLQLRFDTTGNTWELQRRNTGGTGEVTKADTFALDDVVTVIAAWDAANLKVSVDGSAFTSAAAANVPVLTATDLDVGSIAGTSEHLDSDVLWVAYGVGALSDADASTIHGFGNTDPSLAGLPGIPRTVWPADTGVFSDGVVPHRLGLLGA